MRSVIVIINKRIYDDDDDDVAPDFVVNLIRSGLFGGHKSGRL